MLRSIRRIIMVVSRGISIAREHIAQVVVTFVGSGSFHPPR